MRIFVSGGEPVGSTFIGPATETCLGWLRPRVKGTADGHHQEATSERDRCLARTCSGWVGALARAARRRVRGPDEKPAPLGLVGLTEGQTLRISVANVISAFDPQPDPPGACSLQVGFVDREGTVIGDPHIFELRAGLARSFDFVATGDGSVRHYVRPVAVDLRPKQACAAVVSGEILDRGGLNGIIVYDSVAFTDPWLSK